MTNFNISPYYDDFSAEKDYHQILFKPGVSVQARELTQIQSILQNQVKTFGNHVFRQGSIVIPGNSYSDLYLPYIKLSSTGLTDVTTLLGSTGVGQTSGVKFVIKNAIGATVSDPSTLYVGYISGSGSVIDGETLLIGGALSLKVATTNGLNTATGLGSSASITTGVYYVNGVFANVAKQTVIIGKYTSTPSVHVLLKIVESIVTSDTDPTLLDPANGSYNYSAPGADRFKLSLVLTTLPVVDPVGSNVTNDYVELMRFNAGVLEEHARFPKYNELEKSFARRTLDQSGDYIVRGLKVTTREHLKSKFNTGQLTVAQGGSASKFVVNVDGGKAYIQGFENELLSKQAFAVSKARTDAHVKSRAITVSPSFGQYLFVSDILKLPNTITRETIKLYTFSGGVQVGTAKIIALDYHDGNDTTQSAIFRFYITDVALNSGAALANVGYILSSTNVSIGKVLHKLVIPGSGANFIRGDAIAVSGQTRSAAVWKWDKTVGDLYAYRNSVNLFPIINDYISGTNGAGVVAEVVSVGNSVGNSSVIPLPFAALKSIGTTGVSYKVFKYISGLTGTNTATLSIGSITGITIDPLEIGNVTAVGPNGVISIAYISLNPAGTDLTLTGSWASGLPISIVVSVSKVGITSKTKNLNQNSQESGLSPSASVLLLQADIYRLNSVVSSTLGDVTDRYKLDNGQRDYAYLRGRLILVGIPVTSGTLTVSYDYFTHTGTGDFFGPESYSAALSNLYEAIPSFKSPTDGTVYPLSSSIDFRPRENTTSTGYDSPGSDMIIPQSRFSSTIDYYVPQIATVTLDKSSKVNIAYGIPKEIPVAPEISKEVLVLADIFIPAYTYKVEDIRVTIPKNRGYTMAEIGKIEARVLNIEDFTLLTQSEKTTINYNVIDAATGLNRFKAGYLVDTFENPDTIADLGNLEFSVTYNGGAIIPQIERQLVDMTLRTSSNVLLSTSGFVYSLPYTDVTFAKQPLSSRITNLNPFLTFAWTGHMTLIPSFDNWIETEYLPMQINNLQTQTVTVHRPFGWVPVPVGALVQFTPAPPPIINKTTVRSTRAIAFDAAGSTTTSVNGRVTSVVPLTSVGGGDGGGGGHFLPGVNSGNGCFIGGTMILMGDNTLKPIELVVVGDMVKAKDGIKQNQVKLLEVVKMKLDSRLYSPYAKIEPFATDDHPLWIDGILQSAMADKTMFIYPWLEDVKQLSNPIFNDKRVDLVYNLWVDGDYTYQVNGLATTSIIGDPAGALLVYEAGLLSQEEIMAAFDSYIGDSSVLYGVYLVNKLVGRINNNYITMLYANCSKQIATKTCAYVMIKYALKAIGITAKVITRKKI